jgi:hypothetical protein
MADDQTKTGGAGFLPASPAPAPAPTPAPVEKSTAVVAPSAPAPAGSAVGDQLARIEDKTARIEDKYARSESLLSRMEEKIEGATTRMNEVARQSDLAALRGEVRGINERVRRSPGTGALVLTAIITSVLTVVLMVAVERLNIDSMLPKRAAPAATQP